MSVYELYQAKWLLRVRQFGVRTAFVQMARCLLRPVYRAAYDYVLAIPDHRPNLDLDMPEIKRMCAEDVDAAAAREEISPKQAKLLRGFMEEKCIGFIGTVDKKFAGYAFIQPCGTYTFGEKAAASILNGTMLLKNLFVLPDFRGQSLGKKLNGARLAAIPEGQIPIVFVRTENRYAIRNLKMFGFKEMLLVTSRLWLKMWNTQHAKVLCDCPLARRLAEGFGRARVTAEAGS